MLDQTAGIYNFVWATMGAMALWLLYRIFELIKAIHFMVQKWFERDYIVPFEKGRGTYDGD
jgi:hypothetical protein